MNRPTTDSNAVASTEGEPQVGLRGSWSTFQYDVGNSGHTPEVAGPKSDVVVRWTGRTDPAVADDRVVLGGRDGSVYVFDRSSGDRLTRLENEFDPDLPGSPSDEITTSPAVADGGSSRGARTTTLTPGTSCPANGCGGSPSADGRTPHPP